jgi:hypothetical protein
MTQTKPWSLWEDRELMRLSRTMHGVGLIAIVLDRTVSEVSARLKELLDLRW